jgi:hypothetical protein
MAPAALLASSVFRCSRGTPAQDEAKQNIHLAHWLQKAGVIERAGIDRLELCCLYKIDTLAFAVSSSLAMNTWTLRPLRLSVGRSSAKIVLNAFPTLALGASF